MNVKTTGSPVNNVTWTGRNVTDNTTMDSEDILNLMAGSKYYEEDNSEDYSDRVLYLINVEKNIWIYIPPILFVVGLIGNTLSVLVLRG